MVNVSTPLHILIVQPTRCTCFSNYLFSCKTLYMFPTVFPSIIRSKKTAHMATGMCQQQQVAAAV